MFRYKPVAQSMYEKVIRTRNTNWFTKIQQEFLAQPKTTMVLVGAAHLVGSDGLAEQLRSKGYSAIQLPATAPRITIAGGNTATITITGATNADYRVEYSTVSPSGPWQVLTNFTMTSGTKALAELRKDKRRFYRAALISTR